MSANTKIEWCDHSWSPWRGCTKVSPGCANCYAERLSWRNPKVLGEWGKGRPRVLAKNWNEPVKWNKANRYGFVVTDPPVTVFPSLCDWLDDEVPVEWLAGFLVLMQTTPNLTWLLLTKRPGMWRDRLGASAEMLHATRADDASGTPHDLTQGMIHAWLNGQPPRNVWVGTSVEDQKRADERTPELLAIPAAGRFLSVEPLLGQVEFKASHLFSDDQMEPVGEFRTNPTTGKRQLGLRIKSGPKPLIHWVIIGGESGPGARPCNVDWIRSLVRQCKDAGVPVFVKQIGARPVRGMDDEPFERITRRRGNGEEIEAALPYHPKGGDPAEWPEDLRVREYPEGLR